MFLISKILVHDNSVMSFVLDAFQRQPPISYIKIFCRESKEIYFFEPCLSRKLLNFSEKFGAMALTSVIFLSDDLRYPWIITIKSWMFI